MALAVPKDCRLGASVSACARPAATDAAANPAANTAASANFVIANPTWGPLWYRQEIIRQGVPLQGKHQVFCGFWATYRPRSRRRVAAGVRARCNYISRIGVRRGICPIGWLSLP